MPNKTIFGMPGISHQDPDERAAEATAPLVDLDAGGPELELDLPAPAGAPPADDFDLPAPVGAPPTNEGFDLPAPVDMDLPAPVGAPGTEDLDLPAPVELDLPAPAGAPPPVDDLDLPAPANLDLPAPVDLDLPAPADLDLPAPADLDLPAPADLELPEPKDLQLPGPTTDRGGVGPASVDHLDLDLGEATPPMAEPRSPVPDRQAAASANLVDALDAQAPAAPTPEVAPRPDISLSAPDRAGAMRSPAPVQVRRLPKGLIIGGGLVLVLGGAAAGAHFAGLLPIGGDERAAPTVELAGGEKPRAPEGPAEERSEKVLAKLALDTAAGYQQAMQMAEALNDKVGQAEALLLTHLRYGPDPVLVAQADAMLEPFAAQTEGFVTRVVGLSALASNQLDKAEAALTGDEPRTRLYRGWLRIAQGRPADALTEADAVLAASADDPGALHLRAEAKLLTGATDAIENLEQAADAHPDHPLLQQLLVATLLDHGRLKDARTRAAKLDSVGAASKVHQARVLGLRGRVAMAAGERSEAVLRFDQALELAPGSVDVALDRLRVLLEAREYSTVRSQLEILRREHEDLLDVSLIEVELALRTGKGPEALELLGALQGRDETNPQIPYLLGQVHAMRMAVDEAKAAFDQARARDELFYEATIAEAQMQAKAGRYDQALKLLDGAKATMAEAPNALLAVGDILLARAHLQVDAGKTTAAIATLDEALEKNPTHNEARLLRGRLLVEAGNAEKGAEDLVALYEQTGGYPGLAGPLGRIFMRQGKIDEVEKLLGKQADDPRAPPDIVLLSAQLRLAQGNSAAAKTLVEKVLSQDSGSWEGHLVKTQILVGDGDYESALVQIQQARPRTPQPELELWKGKVFEYNGKPDQALPHYAKVMELDPGLIEAAFLHGRLLAYKGAAKSAVAELEPVVAQTDEYPSAWMALGLAYRDLGKYDKAVAAFRKAAADPKLAEASYYEGRLHNDRNKHAKTIRALKAATANAQGNEIWLPQAYRMLGRANMSTNNRAGARKAFEKYLEIANAKAAGRAEVRRLLRDL